ncbi:MAG: hypothetical protein V4515_15155 [Chloroflexota bacterium]
MSTTDLTVLDPVIKEHYSPFELARMAMQKNKATGMLAKSQKKTNAGGREWVQPIMTALPGGGSTSFPIAVTNANNNTSAYKAFAVKRTAHYRLARVDNQAIEATATGDEDAFESAFDEFDNAIEAEGNYMNFRFFRTGNGEVGTLDGVINVATPNMAFADIASVWGIRAGETLQASATLGSALRAGTIVVATVTRATGAFTLTGNGTAGIAALVNTDLLYLNGDGSNAGAFTSASGLADWVPDTAPSATTFFGVDRTAETEFLGGVRITATAGQSIANLLVDAVALVDNIGGDPDVVWLNPITFGTLTKQMEGKWITTSAVGYDGTKIATIGYKGFSVNLNGKDLTLYTDRCCPLKRIYVLTWSSWCMFSAGPAPNFLQKRAGSIIKVAETADAYEARVGEYYNFSCKAPGFNCVIILP